MIYTLGHKSSYEEYFRLYKDETRKKGREEDYPGGSVWKTIEDAEKFLKPGYEVYGVLADWEKDTVLSNDGDWNDLLIDAQLVVLEKKSEK